MDAIDFLLSTYKYKCSHFYVMYAVHGEHDLFILRLNAVNVNAVFGNVFKPLPPKHYIKVFVPGTDNNVRGGVHPGRGWERSKGTAKNAVARSH
jgi:hypothetical protein